MRRAPVRALPTTSTSGRPSCWARYAPNHRLSFFGELPIRTILPQTFIPGTGAPFDDQTGIGDLRAGAKIGLSGDDLYTFVGQVKAYLPTGDSEKGLGTDHWSVEPAVLYLRQLGRASIEAEGGFWLPFGGADGLPSGEHEHFSGNVFFWGIGPSVEVVRTRALRLAPVVELIGWHVLGGFQTVAVGDADASGTKIYNMKFGARVVFNDRGFVLRRLRQGADRCRVVRRHRAVRGTRHGF